ncbi:MAG TPA: hypothetical protein ACHBX0_03695 [Arsenophonus sp.]
MAQQKVFPGRYGVSSCPWRNLLAQWLMLVPDWQMRAGAKILSDKP